MSHPTFEHAMSLDDGVPDDGKRGRLFGGALTDETLASSRRVLSRSRGNPDAFVGLQQWFSPPEAASLIADVFGEVGAVLDPTAGSGALLKPFPEPRRFGVEIDRDYLDGNSYTAIGGDAQAVAPMLRAAGLYFPAVALNPPFGLSWRDGAHTANPVSARAHLCLARQPPRQPPIRMQRRRSASTCGTSPVPRSSSSRSLGARSRCCSPN